MVEHDKRQSILDQNSLSRSLEIDNNIFSIESELSRDSSSITYQAKYNGDYGRLKEWFPVLEDNLSAGTIRHSRKNTLSFIKPSSQSDPSTINRLKEMRNEFLYPYDAFSHYPFETETTPRIQIFTESPNFGNENAVGSVYIWIPLSDPKSYTLKEYLGDMKLNLNSDPEIKLRRLLRQLLQIIHLAKDLNVIDGYSIKLKPESFVMPSDSKLRPMDSRLDLADLEFVKIEQSIESYISEKTSIILSEVLRLDEKTITRVDDSPLILASPVNSDINITQRLSEITSYRDKANYTSLTDLENKITEIYNLTKEIEKKINYMTRLAFENRKDNDFINFYRKNSIANTLFRHPYKQNDKNNSRTLVFGFSNSGQACTDVFMQLGQTIGNTPHITVVTHEPYLESNKKFYLENRPALERFVKIKGKPFEESFVSDIYAYLEFKAFPGIPFGNKNKYPDMKSLKEDPELREHLRKFMAGHVLYDSVVICFGEDNLNETIAQICFDILKEENRSTQVYYSVCTLPGKIEDHRPVPIYFSGGISEIHPVLEDMAFNIHYLWKNQKNGIDLNKLFEAFKDKSYHYTSSIFSTLGIINNLEALTIASNPFKNKSFNVDENIVWDHFSQVAKTVQKELLTPKKDTRTPMDESFDLELRAFYEQNILEDVLKLNILDEDALRKKVKIFYDQFLSKSYKVPNRDENGVDRKNRIDAYSMRLIGRWIQEDIKNELQIYFHRNWLMGKVNSGWATPFVQKELIVEDQDGENEFPEIHYETIIKSFFESSENQIKLHPRILPCRRDSSLKEHFKEPEDWDNINQENLNKLDPIDRFSIKLHEALNKKYEHLLDSKSARNEAEELSAIRIELSNAKLQNPEAKKELLETFDSLLLCLKNIKNGSKNYQRKYPYIFEELDHKLDCLDKRQLKNIDSRLSPILNLYFVRLKREEYRDYKENNRLLVDNLPFILSNRWRKNITQAFSKPKNPRTGQSLYSNLLPIILYQPNLMTYLVIIDDEEELEQIKQGILGLINFLDERRSGTKLNFRFYLNHIDEQPEYLVSALEDLDQLDERIEESLVINAFDEEKSVLTSFVDTLEDLAEKGLLTFYNRAVPLFSYKKAKKTLNSKETRKRLAKIEKKKETEFQRLQAEFDRIVKEKYKTFTFDPNDTRVKKSKTGALEYVETEQFFLSIPEILALDNNSNMSFDIFYPDFAEEDSLLWQLYRGEITDGTLNIPFSIPLEKHKYFSQAWEDLCRRLKENDNSRKESESIILKETDKAKEINKEKPHQRFLPDFSYHALQELIKILKENQILTGSTMLQKWTFDSCSLKLAEDFLDSELFRKFEEIFLNPYHLADSTQITTSVIEDKMRSLKLTYDNLFCKKLSLDEESFFRINTPYNLFRAEADILRLLFDKGLILKPTGYLEGNKKKLSIYEAQINSSWNFYYATLKIKQLLTDPRMIVIAHLFSDAVQSGYFDDVSGVYIKGPNSLTEEIPCLILTKGLQSYIIYYQHNSTETKKDQKIMDTIKRFADKKLINYKGLILTSPSYTELEIVTNGFSVMNIEDYDNHIESVLKKFKEK